MNNEIIRYYGSTPKIAENKIIDYFKDNQLEIQNKGNNYLRLKITPTPTEETLQQLKKEYGVEIKKYVSEDNDSCIVEINNPRFDIIVQRDTSRFPNPHGWVLRLIENKNTGSEIIADIGYNNDSPYGLMIAEHLVEYLNRNKDELPVEFKEIYTYE